MRTNAHVSLFGNLVKDPVLRQANQKSVCNFTVAVNTDKRDENGVTRPNFYDCSVWGRYGENIFQKVQKGTEVLVHGMLEMETRTAEDGRTFTSLQVDVDNVLATRGMREPVRFREETTEQTETADDTE